MTNEQALLEVVKAARQTLALIELLCAEVPLNAPLLRSDAVTKLRDALANLDRMKP